jgi:hypothetical protein
MMWSKIINLLSMPSNNDTVFDVISPTKPIVKMLEYPHILTCQDVENYDVITSEDIETYLSFDNENIGWMTAEDYENPLYDILEEEEEEELTDEDIEYAEHATDYDY